MTMSRFLKPTLTDELLAFVNKNWGDGTLFATPSEFVSDLLLQRKLQVEASRMRDAILDGYEDAIAGRTLEFKGNLRELLEQCSQEL